MKLYFIERLWCTLKKHEVSLNGITEGLNNNNGNNECVEKGMAAYGHFKLGKLPLFDYKQGRAFDIVGNIKSAK